MVKSKSTNAILAADAKAKKVVVLPVKSPYSAFWSERLRCESPLCQNVRAETLISLTVKTVRRGSIIYTDKFRSYDSLMFCGYRHLKIDHTKRFPTGKVYINGLEGFWSWAKERLIKHHGVSKQNFPLYLKKLEFRYNNRHTDIFELVSNYLCDRVPKLN